jgi:hypothetical protein
VGPGIRRGGLTALAVMAALGLLAQPAGAAAAAAQASARPRSAVLTATEVIPPAAGQRAGASAASAVRQARQQSAFRRITLPDLLIVAPTGLTSAQIRALHKIPGFRSMIAFDGARIDVAGHPANAISADPATFRSWVPLRTASDRTFWTALRRGDLVTSTDEAARLRLHRGHHYLLRGATSPRVAFGGAAQLGVTGVDVLVNQRLSGQLGLVHKVAALISAPGARLTALTSAVRRIIGRTGKIVSLRSGQLPVAAGGSSARPTSYLQLFRESAARYCPGLSWTVLAAIGQIESGDGANIGPSSAGALGPMQFLPSTWAVWGTDGFGQTGTPDIMNPYDAVPSAARMLCADGAASGPAGLRAAIFDYNHAQWYVNEVLGLAAEYAADYR